MQLSYGYPMDMVWVSYGMIPILTLFCRTSTSSPSPSGRSFLLNFSLKNLRMCNFCSKFAAAKVWKYETIGNQASHRLYRTGVRRGRSGYPLSADGQQAAGCTMHNAQCTMHNAQFTIHKGLFRRPFLRYQDGQERRCEIYPGVAGKGRESVRDGRRGRCAAGARRLCAFAVPRYGHRYHRLQR